MLFVLFFAASQPAAAQNYLPTNLLLFPAIFQPYSSIYISVDISMGDVPWCDTLQWNGTDVYGSNGYYNYWYTNYRRESFSFSDTSQKTNAPILYQATSWANGCDDVYYGGGDYDYAYPAAPEPIRLRVLFDEYTGNHGGCPSGTSSPWYYWRGYQVVDQWHNDYRYPTTLSETIDTYQNSCQVPFLPANGWNPVGEFTDRFAMCSVPACSSGGCEVRSYQYIHADGNYVRATHLTHSCSGFDILDVFTP
ncbi:MAG: hypothetical protein IT178_19455 [Acidobacteria bacterium]|nr:hypothetical protein [Acidobacteriota bacterium]